MCCTWVFTVLCEQSADLLNRLGRAAGLSSGDMAALRGNYLLFARDAFLANQELAHSLGAVGQEVDRVTKRIERAHDELDGLLSQSINAATGDAISGGQVSGLAHAGGVIMHAGGPVRMHAGGLRPDEVNAILQRGEVVFSRNDVRRFGGAELLDQIRRTGSLGEQKTIILNLQAQTLPRAEDIAEEIAWKLRTVT